MLSKKEKIISSILCVISVVLLIASLCFTTLLFTTHGTILKAEAVEDITESEYVEYFSEDIFPNGDSFEIDETYFDSYDSNFGGYFYQINLDNSDYDPLRLDIAYRVNVALIDSFDTLYDETYVFFPSAYNTDGTLYYGFCFAVGDGFVRINFNESYIRIYIYCDSSVAVDTFVFYKVPSLTTSFFYSSYESLYVQDGCGAMTDGYSDHSTIDCFYGDNELPYETFVFPCFLMIESNVGDLLVYFNPWLYEDINLSCFRVVGIPNGLYTYCQYNDYPDKESFVSLANDVFDPDFVFEFNNVYLVAPVPLNQVPVEDDPSINESLGEVLLQGMTFGFESIGEGITYTFNTLFYDEETGNLTTFTYVIVFALGIGIVLGFIKWILSYIFSLGGKD